MSAINRRDVIISGGTAIAALALFQSRFASAFPSQPGETALPWLDQLAPNPVPDVIQNQLVWEDHDSWITPNAKFFSIAHFNRPAIDEATWKLEVDGLVNKPMSLTLADIKQMPRQEVTFTVECSGNSGLPFFNGGIGNARWAGTPLGPVLQAAGVREAGIEVVTTGPEPRARSPVPVCLKSRDQADRRVACEPRLERAVSALALWATAVVVLAFTAGRIRRDGNGGPTIFSCGPQVTRARPSLTLAPDQGRVCDQRSRRVDLGSRPVGTL